jgi:site-specific DNA recombinase
LKELYDPIEVRMAQLDKQLPQLQAEIDYLKIQHLSADTVLQEARNLYDHWPKLPFEERRSIIEIITNQIIIGKEDISLSLSYVPNSFFLPENGNKQRGFRDSWMQ